MGRAMCVTNRYQRPPNDIPNAFPGHIPKSPRNLPQAFLGQQRELNGQWKNINKNGHFLWGYIEEVFKLYFLREQALTQQYERGRRLMFSYVHEKLRIA